MKIIEAIRKRSEARRILRLQGFAQELRDDLVIVARPKDDLMFMSYRGKQVVGKIRSMDGKNHKVVKNVLKASTFEREMPRFVGGVMDVLKSPIDALTASFWHFLDGALYNISGANELKANKKKYAKTEEAGA